ncbi:MULTISPECIES: folylpolyglutamate synthase/dihydrofolate synthase family protein [Thermoactinomyces]|jgi:dihydrofolate synthase / folylpolyglutamate synthase|uniref:Dihydrofolate synthase/folylpolyglutamate synthase n=1 Tax=Thermoactinomyces daqus TaxID=1329516 RepID=A0A7W1X7A7_9BACL|nr:MULTISPECIES: folylpolyglutamate synthase/dihydrofolate synthase family protein [Thermoactinomyces]MBA4541401.1 bifunctional folylpolyglutamate synthase/dihydrofolate synthase [Thermoactinomyces daqus]MBH8596873.1 bifunctional folylpolyglutamate synthase/dihydrofolate synthase [Thermoactinomyces sp. CICC 10523]MBH8603633.1 bifunctional folylpolyglutamate synthase/dihydrofolate synthase [Thermoactinomyces sp. CICC 10522]
MQVNEGFVTAADVFAWMDQHCTQAIQPGLGRMEWMLERLGSPEKRCKFIHIAGTNGKGSVAAMVDSVLREAGYPVGLFISPYVTSWNERIQFNGEPIPEASFVHWANQLKPLVEEMGKTGPGAPSPFEFWTVLAICFFAKEAFPWFIVWETGLGGRLDSTNVVYPLVSVITRIGMDHKEWLGDTLTAIAREKAGIIKPGVPVVCSPQVEEALAVIREEAKRKKSRLYEWGPDYRVIPGKWSSSEQSFDFQGIYRTLSNLSIPLLGEHQLYNAATALMTLEVLRQAYATVIDPEHFVTGLQRVRWPGRFEKVADSPAVILDGAHNLDGVKALVQAVKRHEPGNGRLFLLLAMMKDKQVTEMLEVLAEEADVVVATEVKGQARSLAAGELAGLLKKVKPELTVHAEDDALAGLRLVKEQMNENDVCVITGSLFLVSQLRPLLN